MKEGAGALPAGARDLAMRVARNDTLVSLGVAMLINSAIMIVAAASLSGSGIIVSSLDDAHAVIGQTLGIGAAVVFAVAYGRVGDISARLLSVYVAGGMLLSLYVVPFLKYPASPPALSLDETIRQRTLLYLLMVALSAGLLVAAVVFGRRLAGRLGRWNATLSAAGAYVVTVAAVMLALPTVDETPGPLVDDAGTILYGGFPADVLYEFRLASLGTQVVIYATIGLVFAALVSRLLGERKQVVSAS